MPAIANFGGKSELFQAPETVVLAEPVALSGTEPKALLHPIRSVLAVYHYDATTGERVDHSASDYELTGTEIGRTEGSSLYDFGGYAITMTGGSYVLVTNTTPRNPPVVMNFLTYVDYETDYIAPITIPALATSPVTGLIITAGDSITGGAHTINREFYNNDGDGYVGLLRSQLYKTAGVYNFSFDGSSIGQLTSNLSSLLAMNPSVLTVAFGQNDHVSGPSGLASFQTAITDIVTACQSAGVRVILVGFMPKNPLWVNYSLTNIIAYNNAIESVATAKSVPFVDIYARWAEMRVGKEFRELTGDNHHHPGNYGSRVYFSAILPYLLSTPLSSADVPAYVPLP